MIDARFDPGLALPLLRGLLDAKLGAKAANAAARQYRADVLDYATGGAAFAARPGGPLAKSIKWRTDGPGALVATKARHAAMMEYGTRPHGIKPKARRGRKALRFGGGLADGVLFRRAVQHPGTPAAPFFFADQLARQSRMTEAAAGVLAAKLAAGAAR